MWRDIETARELAEESSRADAGTIRCPRSTPRAPRGSARSGRRCRRRSRAAAGTPRRRRPRRLVGAALELAHVAADLLVGRDRVRDLALERDGLLRELRHVEVRVEQQREAREQRERRLGVGRLRDVVRDGRPQARRRDAGFLAGVVHDADDAGRALVGRGCEAELVGEVAVGRAGHGHRARVRRVGQEAAERDDELGAALARHLDDAARVELPAVLRLDADHHRDVVAARQRRVGEGVLGPRQAPRVVLAERDDRGGLPGNRRTRRGRARRTASPPAAGAGTARSSWPPRRRRSSRRTRTRARPCAAWAVRSRRDSPYRQCRRCRIGCPAPPSRDRLHCMRPPIGGCALARRAWLLRVEKSHREEPMTLTSEGKLDIVRKFGRDEKDTGSAEVQIALLTSAHQRADRTLAVSQEGSPLAARIAVAGGAEAPPARLPGAHRSRVLPQADRRSRPPPLSRPAPAGMKYDGPGTGPRIAAHRRGRV